MDHVERFSDDIGMQFGYQKCAKLSARRGKLILTGPVPTLESEINELDYGQTYRYLGFPEAGGIDHACSKSIITAELHRRLKLVWGSLLCGQFKVKVTNSFCIPLLSYGFGIVDWTKAEMPSSMLLFVRHLLLLKSIIRDQLLKDYICLIS